MRRRGPNLLRLFSLTLLLIAIGLTFVELVTFSRQRARMPRGLVIAGVPVGGLNRSEASERLLRQRARDTLRLLAAEQGPGDVGSDQH